MCSETVKPSQNPDRWKTKSINDYPKPENGETIIHWIDRIHDLGHIAADIEVLSWHWPQIVFGIISPLDDLADLMETLDKENFFRWGNRIFASNDDDLMFIKLTSATDRFSSIWTIPATRTTY